MTMTEPRWAAFHKHSRDAANIAAVAVVAATVYEAFGWVRWSGHDHTDDDDYHVPTMSELYGVLTDLAERARTAAESNPFAEVDHKVGDLRFLAWADEQGVVDFYLSIGSAISDGRAEHLPHRLSR
jgi:hypothetical protein